MRKNVVAVAMCLTSATAWGQSQTLSGVVKDAAGRPIIGATVVEKGTNNGTATDNAGRFTLSSRASSPRLLISSIGFTSQEVTAGSGEISVSLAEATTSLGTVQVVGSRSQNRSVTDSPSPVDIIDLREVTTKTGQLDVNQLLQFVAPSFNSNRQTGSDGADHVDPASLRGLGPDQTLVLVNGKRQHQSALVNLFGSRGRGNTGTDLNVIPAASIERIEILRDGAAAQYGSDAIAGVINIVLKSSVDELTANVNYGAYDAKYRRDDQKFDGGNFNANLNYGIGLGQGGSFVNATLDFNQRQHTQRAAVPAPDGLARREYGDPKVSNVSAYLNSKFALSDRAHIYVFGGANKRRGDAYAWTRFADDDRNVPAIYPNGFDPVITSDIWDASAVVGVKTLLGTAGWELDLSNNFGSNRFEYGVENSLNATLGATSPTTFDAGGFQLQQDVVSLGLTRNYKTVLQGLNLAAGAEWRREWYSLFAGERASWDTFSVNPEAAPGSQGFPGFQSKDEIKAQRDNFGAYVDAELSITPQWLLAAALRFENYTDFGSTLNYKASTRYNLTEFLTLRGTYSTGFRAPSLAQINFNSTFTNFIGGEPVEVLLARNNSAVTQKLGIPSLKQETSNSANVGLTSRIGSSLSLTLDGYYIKVKDRVVLTSQFSSDDPVIGPDLEALRVGQAQFFANAADTRSLGLDVVLNHTATLGAGGRLNSTLAANFNELKIDRVQTSGRLTGREEEFFGPREQAFVKASAPPSKINLTFDYKVSKWGALLRFVRFDKVTLIDWNGDPMNYQKRITTDLTLSYSLSDHIQLAVGSTNLFNRYPTLFDPQLTETGGAWDPVQMGANGRFYFAKLQARF
ncbi:TonB-dependent receptor [Hymenobacter chitinivorans]|uniref:Iron complex outermembrane receptor protein n=1 Tax=Hymenobacter chitinivorans DSM 11115 TaxID=1121954 RepID=A0A2M9BTB1_9BACT|nr:TonB-dependent receptor [Hymenobacter chitinivorans]PJJ61200.1 iron complex outermembrane receptor protein [Hymenobacter chitinivorans DSM 11115]